MIPLWAIWIVCISLILLTARIWLPILIVVFTLFVSVIAIIMQLIGDAFQWWADLFK